MARKTVEGAPSAEKERLRALAPYDLIAGSTRGSAEPAHRVLPTLV